jgi:peptidyl-prolyl cis-trans isomerase SurA
MTRFPLRASVHVLMLSLGLIGSIPTTQAQPANAKPPLETRSGPTPGAAVAEEAAARARRVPGDHIAVVVNSDVVAGEIAGRAERGREEAQRRGEAIDAAAARQLAQDTLVEERVLVTYARESGARVEEPELDRVVANVAAQNRISIPQLLERLKQDGIDAKRFRENLKDQLLIERIREREVNARIRITDGEIDRLIDDQRRLAIEKAQLNIAQILVPAPTAAGPQRDAAKAKAEAALKRVLAGENFAAVAADSSQDANRRQGGEIGMKSPDKLPELFVQSVTGLAPGEVRNAVVESAAGFHVIKLLERQNPGDGSKVTETRARHILLRPSERLPAQVAAQRLMEFKRAIEAGRAKFEDLAKEHSEDGSAPQGGDLGWAAPGQFVPEFEDAMSSLAVNGMGEPVQSRFGLHLIQVLERRDVKVEPRQQREQARAQLREKKFEEAYKEWIADLRSRAFIELRDTPL